MKKKKVLILGNVWPYVRGGHRAYPLLINLEKEGYKPISVSMWNESYENPPWNLYRVNERNVFELIKNRFNISSSKQIPPEASPLDENFLRGETRADIKNYLKSFFEEAICLPDEYWLSKNNIDKAVDRAIEDEKPDIILSEFPVIYHFSAFRASKKYKIPWVADFVDLWSQNFNYSYSSLRQYIDFKLEEKILSKANALVTVSPVWAKQLKVFNNNSFCIEHSFPELIPDKSNSSKVTILYSGRIYPKIQHYEDFFIYLNEVINDNPGLVSSIEVNFVGEGANQQILEIIKGSLLEKIISINERVSHQEIELLKQEANILMMFATSSSVDGWYTSKLFDYLGANKEIWVFGRNKEVNC